MSDSYLSKVRYLRHIREQISFINFLIYIAAGWLVFMIWSFEMPPENKLEGWCGVVDFRPKVSSTNPIYLKGETIFKANCNSCHKLRGTLVGPGLEATYDKYDREWLYAWIQNSQKMVKEGDPQAVAIFNEYNGSVMPAFPSLKREQIDAVLEYIRMETEVSY